DPDLNQAWTFSLVGAPPGASIDALGVFHWPLSQVASGVYSFLVRVADSGSPSLRDTQKVTVTVLPAGVVNGDLVVAGTAGNDTVGIQSLSAGNIRVYLNGTDQGTFSLAEGHGVHVRGMAGNDRLDLSATAANHRWELTAPDNGSVGLITFVSVEAALGGAGDDTFALHDGASLRGRIDGGLGSNTLDFSARTAGVT